MFDVFKLECISKIYDVEWTIFFIVFISFYSVWERKGAVFVIFSNVFLCFLWQLLWSSDLEAGVVEIFRCCHRILATK